MLGLCGEFSLILVPLLPELRLLIIKSFVSICIVSFAMCYSVDSGSVVWHCSWKLTDILSIIRNLTL